MAKLSGMITVQKSVNGVTSDEKIESLKKSLTPSAHALSKALGMLNSAEPKSSDSKEDEGDNPRSTETYHFEIEAEDAIQALQAIDESGNTEAYDRKRQLLEQAIGSKSIRDLPLSDRISLMQKVRPFSFQSYSYQVSIKVPGKDAIDVKFIHTKKHHRLENLSEDSAKSIMDKFNVTWIDKPKDVKSGEKGSNPPTQG